MLIECETGDFAGGSYISEQPGCRLNLWEDVLRMYGTWPHCVDFINWLYYSVCHWPPQVDGTSPFLRLETREVDEGPGLFSHSPLPGMTAICACRSGTSWQATMWACCKCLWRRGSSTVQQCGGGQVEMAGDTRRSHYGAQALRV